ncbi:MAG: hydrogen peroxide-inducible genes activator [Gammaproteobacteria bacterium]|nr:hydrogen peroxide-inducible genes activator [Gammaproteobacteria bacterium]
MPTSGDKPRITLRQLEYFVAVAETRSFRRAAERLGVSQPTLTSQIANLENAIGARLFERGRGGTFLGTLGRELVRDARRVLEELDGLVERAQSLSRGPGGTFRLGVPKTVGPYLLPHVLPEIHRAYSAVRFYVREDPPHVLEAALLDGEYDLILTTLPISARQLVHVSLCREPLKLVVSSEHRLAGRKQVGDVDLAGEPVLAIEESHPLHSQIQRLCERFGATIRRDYEGTSLDTLRQMVQLGMGVSFLPALYVHSEIRAADGLEVISVVGDGVLREHALVWRPASPSRTLFRELAMRMRRTIREKLASVTLPV